MSQGHQGGVGARDGDHLDHAGPGCTSRCTTWSSRDFGWL